MSLRYLGKRLIDFITIRNTITNELDTVPSSAAVYSINQEVNTMKSNILDIDSSIETIESDLTNAKSDIININTNLANTDSEVTKLNESLTNKIKIYTNDKKNVQVSASYNGWITDCVPSDTNHDWYIIGAYSSSSSVTADGWSAHDVHIKNNTSSSVTVSIVTICLGLLK